MTLEQHTSGKHENAPIGGPERRAAINENAVDEAVPAPAPSAQWAATLPRAAAHWAIRAYQLTISGLIGRQCRYLPTCSEYTDAAIQRHGLWAGGWMGLARICRCHPWGSSGLDPVSPRLDGTARWYRPWLYGRWRRSD